MYNTIVMY